MSLWTRIERRISDLAGDLLLDDYREIEAMTSGENPFGDGMAAQRIVQTLMRRAPKHAGGLPVQEGPALLPTRRVVEP